MADIRENERERDARDPKRISRDLFLRTIRGIGSVLGFRSSSSFNSKGGGTRRSHPIASSRLRLPLGFLFSSLQTLSESRCRI